MRIRFDILLKLFGGEIKDIENKVSNRTFSDSIKQFAFYNFIIVFVFALLGRLVRFIVIRTALNNGRNNLFRLNNRWWYLFNGFENEMQNFDLLLIDAVVETKDGTMIYSGFLVNYICIGEDLDRIYLRDAVRKEFKVFDDKGRLTNQTGIPLTIPGETFSIAYKIIINLNLRFLELSDDIETIEELPEAVLLTEQMKMVILDRESVGLFFKCLPLLIGPFTLLYCTLKPMTGCICRLN